MVRDLRCSLLPLTALTGSIEGGLTPRQRYCYVGRLARDDLLLTRLSDTKVQKSKWAKPGKTHGKASGRLYTGVEATELATDQAEQRSRLAANQTAQPRTPESDIEAVIVSNTTPPLSGESQGDTTIALAMRTPKRLQGPTELIPTLASEPQSTPEAHVQPLASTAPGRIEQGPRKRRRVANKLYRESQYEL